MSVVLVGMLTKRVPAIAAKLGLLFGMAAYILCNFVLKVPLHFFHLLGVLFALIGSWGLAKFGDFFKRLHGPSKATTLGVGCVLLASMLWLAGQGLQVTATELSPVALDKAAKLAAAARVAVDFIHADANRDGRVSRAEYERWASRQ